MRRPISTLQHCIIQLLIVVIMSLVHFIQRCRVQAVAAGRVQHGDQWVLARFLYSDLIALTLLFFH